MGGAVGATIPHIRAISRATPLDLGKTREATAKHPRRFIKTFPAGTVTFRAKACAVKLFTVKGAS